MLRSVKELTNYILQAEDGEIGRCKDFLFDDRAWVVRYMVADTCKWLPGRKVLVSPASLGKPDWASKRFSVRLTKEQIKNSPGLDTDAPVSRQYEVDYHTFWGLPYYWSDPSIPESISESEPCFADKNIVNSDSVDDYLRSAAEVTGYSIQATDGEIGHVEDIILDDEDWMIRYLIVDTRNWLPGKKLLVSPAWMGSVDWAQSKASVHMTKEQLEKCPEYDFSVPISREYEEKINNFYGSAKK
jgi:hypothetical protein